MRIHFKKINVMIVLLATYFINCNLCYASPASRSNDVRIYNNKIDLNKTNTLKEEIYAVYRKILTKLGIPMQDKQ
ncbi:MAG TPA: hypothetical protein QF753_13630 [Victivallales bacterium]|nr:hypothetical protein [Victivallales bacterium]